MFDTLITYAQIFAIGFGFGMIGPCFLVCTPILITYITGSRKDAGGVACDVLIFLVGRLTAYLTLGFLAGLSAELLNRFINSDITSYFKPVAGLISIALGIFMLVHKNKYDVHCAAQSRSKHDLGGLFALGFVIGITPCPPLIALLFEVSLISKNIVDGVLYVFSFGMGTLLSGLIVVGAAAGILAWIPSKLLKSNVSNLVFKILCASLLILLGLSLIWGRFSRL
ncbi:MAG: sulfite exporter TauE/SafE family protein [Candidatus Omnitrophota bacterium]